jgi:hypothetical protein
MTAPGVPRYWRRKNSWLLALAMIALPRQIRREPVLGIVRIADRELEVSQPELALLGPQ